ncbi:Cytochrome c4 precursor [Roseibium album]|nr:Cytochrome c4 precursor [Roseibium album]
MRPHRLHFGSAPRATTGMVVSFLLSLWLQPALADMIDTSSMEPWEVCGLCHSLDGNSRMPKFPKLAGQRAAYIEKQFRDFHDGNRENDGGQMQAITTESEPANLPAIARYFSSLPAPQPVTDDMDTENAATLFTKGREDLPACLTCHGSTDPALPVAPWLEAQHAGYLAKQLTDFQNGNRKNDPDEVMRTIALKLTAEDITRLSVFIAAQIRPERTQ